MLPSQETIRRFHERASALYESPQINRNGPVRRSLKSVGGSRRYKKTVSNRDISEYQVNEPAPTDAYFSNIIVHLLSLAASKPDAFAAMRRGACPREGGVRTMESLAKVRYELCPKVVYGTLGGVPDLFGLLSNSVFEFDSPNHFSNFIVASQSGPSFLC
jgi:hypothetical protein